MKSFRALMAAVLFILWPYFPSKAAQIDFGFGGQWSSVYLTSSNGTANSHYAGPGGTVELRLRTGPYGKSRFGFDVFGLYSDTFLNNANKNVKEQDRQSSVGGGFDVTYDVLFIGYQYETMTSKISAAGYHADLHYSTNGLRAGFNFPVSDNWTVGLTGLYGAGNVTIPINALNVSREVVELRGSLLFSYRLFRIGKKGRY